MLVGFTFSELMLTERKAAILSGRQAQALAAAESGLQMSRIFLLKDKDTQDQAGGWYDNASVFSRRAGGQRQQPLFPRTLYNGRSPAGERHPVGASALAWK